MSHAKFRTVWFCIVVSAHLPAAVHHHSQQPHQQQQHQLRLLNDDNSEALLPTDVEANVEAGSTVLLEFARPFDITMFLEHRVISLVVCICPTLCNAWTEYKFTCVCVCVSVCVSVTLSVNSSTGQTL